MAREAVKRSFNYVRRSKEDVLARTRGSGFDNYIKPQFKTFKPKDGKNMIRILPREFERHYGFDLWLNYNVGVDNGSYLALSKMKGEKDPLAEARKQAERDGDKKLADALAPKQRILMWIIDRNEEDEGPQLWAAPITVDKAFANLSFDEDTKEIISIDDMDEGCDIRFYKEGTGVTTKYDASKMKLQKPSPITDDIDKAEEWIDFIQNNPLPDCVQYYDYDHINNVFNGQIGSMDEALAARSAPVRAPVKEPSLKEDLDDELPFDDPPPQKRPSLRTVEKDPEPEEGESIRDRLRRRRQTLEARTDD